MIVDCVKKVTEEGIDTSDATATAADILSGKSAYVNNEKIVGELIKHTTTIDGVVQDRDLEFEHVEVLDRLPFPSAYSGVQLASVTFNNEIHMVTSYQKSYYKWDGTNWSRISTLPCSTYNVTSIVAYGGEIHIFGYYDDNTVKHYKWNGTTWVLVSTLPYDFSSGSAVVHNNEIHILGGTGNKTAHYKWNGSTWISVSTLPYSFSLGSAVVYNNEIHILGSNDSSSRTKHYKWNGSTWVSVSTLPYESYDGSAVVYNNEIHILGGNGSSSGNTTKHYKWDGTTWSEVSTLPLIISSRYHVIIYDNTIHIVGAGTYDFRNHKEFKNSKWYDVHVNILTLKE